MVVIAVVIQNTLICFIGPYTRKKQTKTRKSITLEPMSAYERKIIHSKIQENSKVETHSIGEGNNRRVVISKIK